MRIPSRITFVDEKLKETFEDVGRLGNKELHGWLVRAFGQIEKNAFCGIQIPKRLIPKNYLQKYRIFNLWKYNLPRGWRLLYSIVGDQIIVISIILEWMDHKEYNRRFKY